MSGGLGSSIPLLGTVGGSGLLLAPEEATISEGIRFGEGFLIANKRFTETDSFGIGAHDATTVVIRPGRIINEVVRMQQSVTPNLRYGWTLAEQMLMAQSLKASMPAILSEGLGVGSVLNASIAVAVLQGLGIAATPLPSMVYTQTLLQGLRVADSFRNFFGAGLADGLGVSESLARQFRPQPVLADGIGIAPALGNHLFIRVTMSDSITLDDASILNMVYNGTLADEVEIVAGYVSPDGQFTTWVINTRTGAATEYDNYAFNSFARIDNRYLGASSSGLYELLGDDDDGTDIIAHIKSGLAQWGGSKFTMFKAAYLGIRGGGDFVLKVVTGDGKTYIYEVSSQDVKTTKVNVGKGIRTRYFAFELISSGQDFNLDTIEFVPLVVERRV